MNQYPSHYLLSADFHRAPRGGSTKSHTVDFLHVLYFVSIRVTTTSRPRVPPSISIQPRVDTVPMVPDIGWPAESTHTQNNRYVASTILANCIVLLRAASSARV